MGNCLQAADTNKDGKISMAEAESFTLKIMDKAAQIAAQARTDIQKAEVALQGAAAASADPPGTPAQTGSA